MKRIAVLIVVLILMVGCRFDSDHGVENGMTLYNYAIIAEVLDVEECLANCPDPPVYKIEIGDSVFALHSEHSREPGDIVLVEFGVKWTNQIPGYEDMLEVLMIRIVE